MTAADLDSQGRRLVELGVPALAGVTEDGFMALVEGLPNRPGAVLVVHPKFVPASRLAPLLRRNGKPGFVVADMNDLDEFDPVVSVPDAPLYVICDIDRGDDMRNWTPNEALPELTARGRTPLTVGEGISWLLQQPERLETNYCLMTIGSRKRRGNHLDARTPALWISGGTGRDGPDNRGAAKVGWCWAGNRHTWLGFASAVRRCG